MWLEWSIWFAQEKVSLLLGDRKFAESLFKRAQGQHKENKNNKEYERSKARLYGVNSQIEALAERLAELPKTLSPAPIYKQMEILEQRREQIQKELDTTKSAAPMDTPMSLQDFETFRINLQKIWVGAGAEEKAKILRKLIHRIEIGMDRVKIFFHAGLGHFFMYFSSNSLTNGAPGEFKNHKTLNT